jgi:hypothetical protein
VIRSNTPEVLPICCGDNIEIALNYYSLRGLVDISSVQWLPILVSATPESNMQTYRAEEARNSETDTANKLVADLGRICELEDSERWRDFEAELQSASVFNFHWLETNFIISDVEYSHVDIYALKVTLIADKPGIASVEKRF